MKPRALRADEVEFELELLPEDDHPDGHFDSGDAEADAALVREILETLNSGYLEAWCTVKVTAKWRGWRGTDYLGAVSVLHREGETLRNQLETLVYDDYDMRGQALEDLNRQISEAYDKLEPLLAR